jgi:cytochrome c
MPPVQYTAVHRGARLSAAEIAVLGAWATVEDARNDSAEGARTSSGDAERGKVVFEKRCAGCHSLANDREGPRLRDVFGREAGSVQGFGYSDALRRTHMKWDDSTLERWLTDPDAMVPGNDMSFRVVKPQERADVIRYLRAQAGR